MSESKVYDKIIVGGGPAALQAAHEMLVQSKETGKPLNVLLLADVINSPSAAGTNLVAGLDNFEENDTDPRRDVLNPLVWSGVERVYQVANQLGMQNVGRGYQLLGTSSEDVNGTADWLVEAFGYAKQEFTSVKNGERINFAGYSVASSTRQIGQINLPEYEELLLEDIRRLGGEVRLGTTYFSHQPGPHGISLHTDQGDFHTSTPPLLATGATHLNTLEGLQGSIHPQYTIAGHIQLTREECKRLTPNGKPVAFCDTNVDNPEEMIWGSLDNKGVLTIGYLESSDPHQFRSMKKSLQNKVSELVPWLGNERIRHGMAVSFGAMAQTDDKHPIMGRFDGFDVSGAYASRGVAQSRAFAMAYAKWVLNGDDAELKLFEDLHPRPLPAPSIPVVHGNRVMPATYERS